MDTVIANISRLHESIHETFVFTKRKGFRPLLISLLFDSELDQDIP